MIRLSTVLIIVCAWSGFAAAQTTWYVDCTNPSCPGAGTVGDPFCDLQVAIQAANDGDTVLVGPCTYVENIDFLGKAVRVRSTQGAEVTIIDGNHSGSVVTFHNGEPVGAVLDGFTVTNGSSAGISCRQSSPTIINTTITGNANTTHWYGGGIYCGEGSAPFISDVSVIGNSAYEGGGINCGVGSAPLIQNALVSNNTATGPGLGGGIAFWNTSARILNTTVTDNRATIGGGALVHSFANPTLVNVTVSRNQTYAGGGTGIQFGNGASVTLTNAVIWGNIGSGSAIENNAGAPGTMTATYSDIQGGYPGIGNINADPLFLDPVGGNFDLTCTSPCVDAGRNNPGVPLPPFDLSGRDLRVIGPVTDMGADEVGVAWDLIGVPKVGGPPVSFSASAPASHPAPNVSEVYLSLGDGRGSGGIVVPGSGGRTLGLDPDSIFSLWLGLPTPLRQVTLSGCAGTTTTPVTVPASTPVGLTVHYAGLAWDLGAGRVTSVSPTKSAVTQ
ncbi:MAG: right-handed parallel beta-helix repeat-containing protein [Planctomycetota bacterium]